jgi:hypothetical protein
MLDMNPSVSVSSWARAAGMGMLCVCEPMAQL